MMPTDRPVGIPASWTLGVIKSGIHALRVVEAVPVYR
jgi:hypothetical protein